MVRNRMPDAVAMIVALLASACACGAAEPLATLPASQPATAGADWPQWRGPNRDGIAANRPKLLDTWPKEGPKLLWKSGPIPSGTEGGCGSVTVAGGKVFVFVHWRHKGAKNIVITTKILNDLGWMEGVPEDLAKKVEETRKSAKVTYLISQRQAKQKAMAGDELEAYIKTFTATLDADVATKYGAFIQKRLHDTTFDWGALVAMAAIRDQEFASWDDLLKKAGFLIFAGDDRYNAFRDELIGQGYHYTDTIVCLDADSGNELWKKEFPGVVPTPAMMMYIGASSTPAVWDDKCYVTGSAGFYCVSVKDGSVVWQAKTRFSNSSPLVANGAVYAFVPELTAFDAKDGKVLWTAEDVFQSEHASVVLWSSGGKDYIVGANGGGVKRHVVYLFCLDAQTGKKVWARTPDVYDVFATYSTPVIEDGILAMTVGMGGGQGFKITPEGATPLWTINVPDYRGASLLVHAGQVYASSGRYFSTPLQCFDLRTGEAKWVGLGDHGGNAEGASPVLADGKILAQIKDPDAVPERGGSWTVMFRAAPEKFEELGQFHSGGATCVSPSVASGKLYLRQQNAIACWDIAEHRPYMSGAGVVKDELLCEIKQAEGGVTATGAVEGVVLTDASGTSAPAKVRLNGGSLVVDLKNAVFPVKVSYAGTGNVSAKNGPLAPFEWRSPRLMFERCEGNTLVMKFERRVDPGAWKSDKAYAVAGAKITGADVDWSGEVLRLTTDKTWKSGERATVRYPACLAPGAPAKTAEATFTVTPGRPVTDEHLYEYLMGEVLDLKSVKGDIWGKPELFEHDTLDKNVRPVAGDGWKVIEVKHKFNLSPAEYLAPGEGYEYAIAHFCAYVHAEADTKVQFWVWGDDGLQIHVNGRCVYMSKPFQHGKIKDVELKKGWNTVLLGLSQQTGGWCLTFTMRNEQGDGPPTGLRYTAERPEEMK